jgi:hypothetical protein
MPPRSSLDILASASKKGRTARSLSDPSVARKDIESHLAGMSPSEKIARIIRLLKDERLSPFDLVLEVLKENNAEYSGYRNELYKDNNEKLATILNSILGADSGKKKLRSWMQPHALEIVCEAIDKEIDSVTKEEVLPGISAITPEFIKSWTVEDVCEQAPFLTKVLLRAAQTSRAKEKNKKKHPEAVCVESGPMH